MKKYKRLFKYGTKIILLVTLGTLSAYAGINCTNISSPQLNTNHTGPTNTFYEMLEYNRRLERVVISLSVNDTTLNLHDSLIISFPEYTHILLLLPKSNLSVIARELQGKSYGGRTILVPFDTTYEKGRRTYLFFPEETKLLYGDTDDDMPIPFGTVWAQDLFEIIVDKNGRKFMLLSDAHKWFISVGDRNNLNISGDNAYVNGLRAVGVDIKRSKLVFNGGNILIDQLGGKRLVFSGGDMLRKTKTVWKATWNSSPTELQIINMLKESFNADEVIIIGRNKVQPAVISHLDQAMIFLSNGTVAITNIVGEDPELPSEIKEIKEAKNFLAELRSTLSKLGYKIINIDTSVDNILKRQHYVNAIPYIDMKTNQKTLLMPVFSAGPFGESLEKKNIAVFESIGYKVIRVSSKAYQNNGGIHCLVNVLE